MKYKIFIAVIIVFGLAVLAATWRQGILRNAHLVTVDLEPYETTVLVNTNDAFVFRHAKGIGIALFDSIDWEQSRYRVRALNPVTGEETSNTVEVRHKQLDLDVISFDTSERDSHYVQAGEVWIPWSYHNPGEAWVTYHSNLTEFAVVPADQFDVIDLNRIKEYGVQQSGQGPLHKASGSLNGDVGQRGNL